MSLFLNFIILLQPHMDLTESGMCTPVEHTEVENFFLGRFEY
jgi:hypothetical protein